MLLALSFIIKSSFHYKIELIIDFKFLLRKLLPQTANFLRFSLSQTAKESYKYNMKFDSRLMGTKASLDFIETGLVQKILISTITTSVL